MKLRNLFLGAIAMVAAFSACEEQADEALGGNPSIELVGLEGDEISFDADGGESQVALIANRNWTIEEDATWIEVTPTSGSASGDQQVVTIKVLKNELDEDDPTAGFDREDDIKFTVGAKSTYLTIKQAGPQGSTEALVVYYNNFDVEGQKAEKNEEDKWDTYLDSFEGWKNETGTGTESVTYAFESITARTNSSNGSAGSQYSIYDGSGMNYLWFGSGKPYLVVKDITLPEGKVDFKISFGSERYLYEAENNTFNWDEFKAYVSIDGAKWSVPAWEFAGEELPDGKWDLASAVITVPEGTTKLYLYFAASMASAYALDDLKVEESLVAGTVIDFANGEEITPGEAEEGGESDAAAIYSNNYDKLEAKKEYGSSGNSYPYLDQFDGWMNHAGTGASNVTYAFSGMSARANSYSNGSYSDYEGSGLNNLFFGSNAYFATNNIELNGATDLTLTFGTEKYSQDNGSVFTNSEYHIWLSNDGGQKWVEFTDYTFAGGTTEGRWNVATANFTVPAGTETISICMQVDVASSYRLDDFNLIAATTAGTAVDFTNAAEKDFSEVTPEQGGESDAAAIYSNNYDKTEATKTYGSNGNSYPYLDQFDGWMNHAGTGAANVTYAFSGMSARSNSTSDGTYSDYEGSGMNNIFFGKSAYFATNNIVLDGATDLTLTFGTEKYSQTDGSVFTNSEYHIWLSNDGGKKWVEFTDYTFAGGTKEGRWNVATANFTVPAGTETLSICMQVDVASAYRLDDFKLVAGTEAGTAVDFSQAVEKDFTAGSGTVTPPAGEITDVTVAEFNAKPVSTTALYRLTGTVGGPINTQYGNFDLIDETGKVYVYGISNWSEYSSKVAEGVTVTVVGQRGDYNGKIEVLKGYIESCGGESGEVPTPTPDGDVVYGNDFDKQISSKTNDKWPYLDQFDGWMNEVGTGATNVSYTYKSASARATNSNNNIWLPKTGAYLSIQDIALNGSATFKLAFNVICGSPGNYKKTFSSSVFKVYVSADKATWVELPVNVTANGTDFDSAVTTFSVPAGTESLSITFEKLADETDGYRVDAVKLTVSETADNAVDFSQGTAMDFSAGGSGSGNTGGETPAPPAEGITDVTVAEFNAKPIGTALYRLTGTVGGPINTKYGNFDIIDETGKVYVYGISNWSDYSATFAEGGTVTVVGQRGDYNGKIEVLEGYIENYTAPAGGGETPEVPETPVTPPTGGEVTGTVLTISRETMTGIEWTTNSYGSQNISDLSTYLSWEINGVGFIGAKMCLPQSSNAFSSYAIQCQGNTDAAKQARFGNTTSVGKIKKITVISHNEKYAPNFNLALGTEQVVGVAVPSSMIAAESMTTTKDGTTYTTVYEPTEDVGFFAIYKNTTGALYFSEVIVEYEVAE